ncbi:MAG: hypothetical protein IT426_06550 [Pirellulales bacterium]|nr:hypothetical protein [Pirellulales bacterium]
MNYLAHALPFFDRPYFAAATGAPDWLSVVDRRVRLRMKQVEAFLEDGDPVLAAVAGGVAQHLRDDAQFHGTRAFFEVTARLSDLARNALGDERGPRANFLGHLLCEVLLDAAIAAEDHRQVERYYEVLEKIDPTAIESAVNRMAPRRTERLALFIGEFRRARILWDYREDGKLVGRLNQVMRRVGLPPLPDGFAAILPEARQAVAERKVELFNGIPAGSIETTI